MPAKDVEVVGTGIAVREHYVRRNILTGRASWPFKYMVLGDFIVLMAQSDAQAARDAVKSFSRRYPEKRFSVRQRANGDWVCRRVQ
jgi:hypothetical protein